MAKIKVIKAINFLEENLRKKGLKILKIILFGSYASGKATKESDVDLVIVSNDFENKDIFDRVKLLKDAEIATIKKFMLPLDIVMLTPEEFESDSSLITDYINNGKIIFSA